MSGPGAAFLFAWKDHSIWIRASPNSSSAAATTLWIHQPSTLWMVYIVIMEWILIGSLLPSWASVVAQLLKNPPAIWETWIPSLSWEDPLEKGKVTHSSILAWRIPLTVQSMGLQRVRHNWATFTFVIFFTSFDYLTWKPFSTGRLFWEKH